MFSTLDRDDVASLAYSIRMSRNVLPSTFTVTHQFTTSLDTSYAGYWTSGFLTLMETVGDAVQAESAAVAAAATADGGVYIAPFPLPSFASNAFYNAVGPIIGLIMSISMLYTVSRLIKLIVEEKEMRMKETLKMMGLRDWVFVSSWALTYFVLFTIISALVTIMLTSSFLSNSDTGLVFLWVFLFAMSQITLSFLASAFFSRARLAAIIGPLLNFAMVVPSFIYASSDGDSNLGARQGTAILAPTAFAYG